MPQNDATTLEAIIAWLAAALSAVTAWAWAHTHGLVKAKADASSLDTLISRVEKAHAEQREDNKAIFKQIEKVADAHIAFAQQCAEEFGKRPTREECRTIWHREES